MNTPYETSGQVQAAGLFTINQDTPWQRPSLTGNGELVTAFGPTGYHTGEPIPSMQVFVLAGRRTKGITCPLVRFGQIMRSLEVGGVPSEPLSWNQAIRPMEGVIVSALEHNQVKEETLSFVCLDTNAAIFRTRLQNRDSSPITVCFSVKYRFGDWAGNITEGTLLAPAAEPGRSGASMYFELESHHAGKVELVADRPAHIRAEGKELELTWTLTLEPGQEDVITTQWSIGDKRSFRYSDRNCSFEERFARHTFGWKEFMNESSVELPDARLMALRQMCLYSLRCNATRWSIPPLVSPSQWEGRTFHDELYAYLGLASSGHGNLARNIPNYRLSTMDKARVRSAWKGAKFAWESTEDGEDGSPYGPWLEEHFHMAQIAETAWNHCNYVGGDSTRALFYPLFREIADYYILNLVEWGDLGAEIRPCTDFDEAIYPVSNGIYTMAAVIDSLQIAFQAGSSLGESEVRLGTWQRTIESLQQNLPMTPDGTMYKSAKGAMHRHIGEAGPVFPFGIFTDTEVAERTLFTLVQALQSGPGLKPGTLPGYDGSRWLWTTAHIATAFNLLKHTTPSWDLLQNAPESAGPGMISCEHINADGSVALPFFTTSAGAFVHALNTLFVVVPGPGITRLNPLPDQLENASFRRLAGAEGLRVSCRYENRRVVSLELWHPLTVEARLELPKEHFAPLAGQLAVVDLADNPSHWLVNLMVDSRGIRWTVVG